LSSRDFLLDVVQMTSIKRFLLGINLRIWSLIFIGGIGVPELTI